MKHEHPQGYVDEINQMLEDSLKDMEPSKFSVEQKKLYTEAFLEGIRCITLQSIHYAASMHNNIDTDIAWANLCTAIESYHLACHKIDRGVFHCSAMDTIHETYHGQKRMSVQGIFKLVEEAISRLEKDGFSTGQSTKKPN